MKFRVRAVTLGFLALGLGGNFSAHALSSLGDALTNARFGLYDAEKFRLSREGDCGGCQTPKQALWYFHGDQVAVPMQQPAGFERNLRAQADVRQWAITRQSQPSGENPLLVWVGFPQFARGTLAPGGDHLLDQRGERLPLGLVAKIESNRSFYNADSLKFFAGRSVKARGSLIDGKFIARTLWPDDFSLKSAQAVRQLTNAETLSSLVRDEQGGATSLLESRVLWHRQGGAVDLAGKAVMAFVLNGAQGDDDEAHGGHFAIATGYFGPQGEWDEWLVNNFYNLDSVSEKGIIAASLPMDAYQGDLNSGQSWYRPSYMLVAVFKDSRVPTLYQEAISRVFNHFYRHDFSYNHATANCAGINLETLRSLGWNIPRQGSASRLKAVAALPYMTVKEASLDKGRKAYDYLTAEKTDLYPFVAFSAVGEDILQRIISQPSNGSPYEKMMAEDIEALLYVRIPQFPSSRAMGMAPVASLDEFMKRVPQDKSQWKIVPTDPRPFPAELKDTQAPAEEVLPSTYAVVGYGGFFAFLGIGGWHLKRRRRSSLALGEKS